MLQNTNLSSEVVEWAPFVERVEREVSVVPEPERGKRPQMAVLGTARMIPLEWKKVPR